MLSLRSSVCREAKYYSDDILTGPEAYPEAYFARLVQNGFNAVWLRGILRDLAPSASFRNWGRYVARHQDALALVVERAKAYGVSVLLYLNQPLCLPARIRFGRSMRRCAETADLPGWMNGRRLMRCVRRRRRCARGCAR